LKPSGRELRDFTKFVKKAGITDYSFEKAEMAILIPNGYYTGTDNAVKRIYTSFILSKGCGAGVDFVWEDEDLTKYKLIVIPATDGLTTPGWRNIKDYVKSGGMIYHITGGNWSVNAYYNELFGVEVQAHEKDFGYDKLYVKKTWGCFDEGRQIGIIGGKHGNYVHVNPQGAQVICEFKDGTPAVLRNTYGNGAAYLSVKPLEDGLLEIRNSEFINNSMFDLYSALIDESNIERGIRCLDHRVETGCMKNKDNGDFLAICVNHDTEGFKTRLYLMTELKGSINIEDLLKDENIDAQIDNDGRAYIDVSFEPAGVNVFKFSRNPE